VIRFSAALVAVAIGVLIGGIATSKLLLVYIAIAVSAVALLALAIGVVVKREELFGKGQGLVPAGAGTAPVQSASAGERQDQPGPAASVPLSAPFQGPTAGYGAFDGTTFDGGAFSGTAQAAPPVTAPSPSAANPPAPAQAPDGPGRSQVADTAPRREAQTARDQWSSSPWPASTAADPAPDWMPGGQAASDPVGQAAPSPSSTVSPQPPAPSGASSAGPEPAVPNWFAPLARAADAAPPATEAPADAAPRDEDDDWPTRYSWLDDLDDETQGEADEADAPVGQAVGARAAGHSVPESSALDATADDAQAGATSASDAPASDLPPAEAPAPVATDAERQPGSAEQATEDTDGERPSAGQAGPAQAAGTVAVLRGVPRYHQPDCVLIRFMPEADIRLLPAAQAKADGCTPCAACQPAG
jgi:hypothetical protein